MPKIKFNKVLSCSSEHSNHPASNLLLEPGKGIKWITNQPGAEIAEVILQLEVPCKIKNINIGNAHSANVSVLVKNSMKTGDDFQTILPVVTLMSPIESRNSEKSEQVKTFLKSDLDESVAKLDYWDLIKVVCTQPFNKQVNYGLAFLSVFGEKLKKNGDDTEAAVPKVNIPTKPSSSKESPRMLGKFKFREDSPEDDELKGLSLLNKWKNERQGAKLVTPPSRPKQEIKPAPKVTSRNRNSLLLDDDPDAENNKRIQHSAKKLKIEEEDKKRKAEIETSEPQKKRSKNFREFLNEFSDDLPEKPKEPVKTTSVKPHSSVPSSSKKQSSSGESRDRKHSDYKKTVTPPQEPSTSRKHHNKPTPITKPFDKLFEGVTIVISGIQNPERADIRKQALEMGARYCADWNHRCTHLICAFKNTPKYKEVHGKGKIITKDWIFKSYKKRRRLPWRRFALDDKELEKDESEEEILEQKPESPKHAAKAKKNDDDILAMYDLDYDAPKSDEVYDRSTDDDGESRDNSTSRKIFDNQKFFLHINCGNDDIKKLEQIVQKHNGKIIKEMHTADFVITRKRLKRDNFGITGDILSPKWLCECEEMESLVPVANFLMEEE